MPVTRLQPLAFPEPERFIAYIEEDPSLVEEGLTVVSRHLPLPGAGPAVILDLLAVDSDARIVHIDVRPVVTASALETAAAAREWICHNLATLQALCPPLARATGGVRSVIIGGRLDPVLESLLAQISRSRPDIYVASLFESATGPAVSLRPLAPQPGIQDLTAATAATVPARAAVAEAAPSDPLAGIPLSPEEFSEFQQLVSRRQITHGTRRKNLSPALAVEN